ncbi:hypothetical protein ACFFUB_07555 [Algimonas porphyrae]|uniref:Uncharacterized protein n=1 Tax=Algimonas porphyrae TaxID=1128113 RepID=A0ABQ5V0J5_9PROT|nr:hypothetical protein [Algimonas porphyrae]GLQ20971.1 hypothetical protein GCM10007854_19260 [Algimonas porphyrae]
MIVDVDNRRFSPVTNSEGGRVSSDAVFTFHQNGHDFRADYAGAGFTDGHLIGRMNGSDIAELVYHCRAPDGALEVGEATALFKQIADAPMTITMAWRWLNGTQASGTSHYREILND